MVIYGLFTNNKNNDAFKIVYFEISQPSETLICPLILSIEIWTQFCKPTTQDLVMGIGSEGDLSMIGKLLVL